MNYVKKKYLLIRCLSKKGYYQTVRFTKWLELNKSSPYGKCITLLKTRFQQLPSIAKTISEFLCVAFYMIYKFVYMVHSMPKFSSDRNHITQSKILLQQFPSRSGNVLVFFVQRFISSIAFTKHKFKSIHRN